MICGAIKKYTSLLLFLVPIALFLCLKRIKENKIIEDLFVKEKLIPKYLVKEIDCSRIFNKDYHYIDHLISLEKESNLSFKQKSDSEYAEVESNCENYRKSFVTDYLSYEEASFPIAFQIVMYKDVAQLEILLKEIYRPQNEYCIHVDRKSNIDIQYGVRSIAKCFSNIEVIDPIDSVDVRWSKFTNLEPEIICARNLWKRKTKWKYLINLTGQEFPLQTMYDIVQILKAFNGSNSIQGTVKGIIKSRFEGVKDFGRNVVVMKGAVHIIAQRGYIDYILHNKTAIDFLSWVRQVKHPDETYFASLNHSPKLKVPGSYLGKVDSSDYPFLTRYKNWKQNGEYCYGKRVRSICIFGMKDIPALSTLDYIFANKFHINYQPYALQCMAELIRNRTIYQHIGLRKFDVQLYKNLDMSHNHYGPNV
ncbi:unnamed protein product [Dimorphilus gyrociliatus]|uniref:Uncharacterized protein n=1 Tax=Dimorphilus gyrociliatus TaxID=2664684 RepID=A0A7I8VJ09_9ANNE|nr:unnamed protein product [Dimorphilus gyrociliatus]